MSRLSPNCRFTLFRGFNAGDPYQPPMPTPAARDLRGLLRPHVRAGRFGFDTPLRWTNVLLVPLGTDIRGGFDSHGQAFDSAAADTVLVADYPWPGACTAFVVVLVQRVSRGGRDDHLCCYLDRAQPRSGACPDQGGVTVPCCDNPLPATLHATFTDVAGCIALQGVSVSLTHEAGQWRRENFTLCPLCPAMSLSFSCEGSDCPGFRLGFIPPAPCGGIFGSFPATHCSCDPLVIEFVIDPIPPFDCCVGAGPRFQVTITE